MWFLQGTFLLLLLVSLHCFFLLLTYPASTLSSCVENNIFFKVFSSSLNPFWVLYKCYLVRMASFIIDHKMTVLLYQWMTQNSLCPRH